MGSKERALRRGSFSRLQVSHLVTIVGFKTPILVIDTSLKELSDLKNESVLNKLTNVQSHQMYKIRTLPLVIVYKSQKVELREVPSLATSEKIYRIASFTSNA